MNPLVEVDLAGTWRFVPNGSGATTIQVPGGGWLKQGFSCEAGWYERGIDIPATGRPQVTRLELEAVNHQAEYWIGEDETSLRMIASEVTAFTPQVVDLTAHVKPGKSYLLRAFVRAYRDGRPVAPHCAEWCEAIARGIFRGAYLRVYPQLFISDIFVKTSVAECALRYEANVVNASADEAEVTVGGMLSSSDGDHWSYPELPEAALRVPPEATAMVAIGPIPWELGPESYWWPNVPYQPGHRCRLHWLQLVLRCGAEALHTARCRFGFREIRQAGRFFELNGIRVNFRGDNLQVANYDRIDWGGKGDAIDTLPGFLPPSDTNPGWPRAVDNFLRLNYNVQRQHMGPWSPYMIGVCDEMGLMLIGESASRWNGFDMENGRGFHEVKCLQDIVRRDRNHPSIVRWSTKNEAQCQDESYHVELYEAVKALDDTRPIYEDFLVGDWGTFDPDRVFGRLRQKDDFTWVDHYTSSDGSGRVCFTTHRHNDAVVPQPDRPYGLGEADWMASSTPAGVTWFATTVALARAQGASDVRPYAMLGTWASSIPGVKTTDFLTEEGRRPLYGEDNLPDPWSHRLFSLLQQACHPLLAMDYEFWWENRASNASGCFPVTAPRVQADSRVTREITMFNDEFTGGHRLELRWEIREGSPSNWILEQGTAAVGIRPGFMERVPIAFHAPRCNTHIFLTLRVVKQGAERFVSSVTCFEVTGGEDWQPMFAGEAKQFL